MSQHSSGPSIPNSLRIVSWGTNLEMFETRQQRDVFFGGPVAEAGELPWALLLCCAESACSIMSSVGALGERGGEEANEQESSLLALARGRPSVMRLAEAKHNAPGPGQRGHPRPRQHEKITTADCLLPLGSRGSGIIPRRALLPFPRHFPPHLHCPLSLCSSTLGNPRRSA